MPSGRKHDDEVQLYAFDIMALDGEDLRPLPLSLRKTNLARLVCTENLNPTIMVMKSAKDGA